MDTPMTNQRRTSAKDCLDIFTKLHEAIEARKEVKFTMNQYIVVGKDSIQLNVDDFASYVNNGRLHRFVMKAIEEAADTILLRARELEILDFQQLKETAEIKALEFSIGKTIGTTIIQREK